MLEKKSEPLFYVLPVMAYKNVFIDNGDPVNHFIL